ncbi:MFS general substrate transporter [Calocera cornea HHB12733]|uniref:MFS general substrate transporter n=1 Tax=Calocera cornea HHB12733 TaxID=1353952 RepID=A0A165CYD4_9BASI|nr:MFS general substrate transporter [Calocera cornea HHB12733]
MSIIICAVLAMMMNSSSIQALVIAIPSMQQELNINSASLQWLVTAYALTSGCFLLLFGRLADIFGRKLVFLLGTVWWVAFTLGCGFAKTGIGIIMLRALSGMGGAAVVPSAVGILAHTFPPSQARTVAFATFQAGAPTGGALGSIIGGLTTQYAPVGWRAIFFVSAGIGAVVFVLGLLVFPNHPGHYEDKRVDWLGAFCITASLIFLMFCLGQGEVAPQGWKTPYIIALLILSGVLFSTFIAWEHYVETRLTLPPLVRLNIFKRGNGKLAAILLVAFLIMGAFTSWQYWATLYYQDYKQFEPIETTVRFIPMQIVGISINVVFALIAAHVSGHLLIVLGCIGTAIACLLFAIIDTNAIYWAYGFPAAVLDVFGADTTMGGGALFVAKVALLEEQSLAGGVFNTIITLGTSFTTTVTTIVYDTSVRQQMSAQGLMLNAEGSNVPLDVQLYGYRRAQWACFGFAAGG